MQVINTAAAPMPLASSMPVFAMNDLGNGNFEIPATERSRRMSLVEPLHDGQRPRWYQVETPLAVVDYLRQGYTRPMIKLPTGAGKTKTSKILALSAELREVLGVVDRPLRVLFLSHKKRLNRQAKKEYAGHDSIDLILQSVYKPIPDSVVKAGWDVSILDECHHEAMYTIQMMLGDISSAPIVGITADEKRGDGLLLKFDCIINLLTERMAAEAGYIEKVGVNTILDYGSLNKAELTKKLFKQYHRHMGATLLFMATNDECAQVGEYLNQVLKIPTIVLGKGSTEAEVDDALRQLSSGIVKVVANCNLLGEGVDSPYVTDVVLAREFRSPQQKKQFIGRAIRPDSPCQAWEFINPLRACVTAKSVVGATKFERLLSIFQGKWTEKMISGEDDKWGQMELVRAEITDSPVLPLGMNAWDDASSDLEDDKASLEEASVSPSEVARLASVLMAERAPRPILTLKRKAA